MSFISMELLLLVLAAAIIYYSMPKRFQWILLLVVSYVFYASYSLKAMSFIVFTTISTYIGTRVIERIATRGKAELAARKKSMSAQEKKALKGSDQKKQKIGHHCNSGSKLRNSRIFKVCELYDRKPQFHSLWTGDDNKTVSNETFTPTGNIFLYFPVNGLCN